MKISANLQYQIENTGVKSFRILLPTNAESVHFQGDQVGDFLADPAGISNGRQAWDVKMRRRVLGTFLLGLVYQTPLPAQATETTLHGIQATGVNLQRGFVTVQSDPRLEVAVDAPPSSLQPAEWQSIPLALQKDLPVAAASLTYRLVAVDARADLDIGLRAGMARAAPASVRLLILGGLCLMFALLVRLLQGASRTNPLVSLNAQK